MRQSCGNQVIHSVCKKDRSFLSTFFSLGEQILGENSAVAVDESRNECVAILVLISLVEGELVNAGRRVPLFLLFVAADLEESFLSSGNLCYAASQTAASETALGWFQADKEGPGRRLDTLSQIRRQIGGCERKSD